MSDQTILRVAWLYYMENLTQAEIGERLGLTRARVNRMLSEARHSGIVSIRFEFGVRELHGARTSVAAAMRARRRRGNPEPGKS